MKKIILIAGWVFFTQSVFSQSLVYADLARLFARDDFNGSARFEALSGAFGALGGDISALTLNPAGLSVFTKSMATLTFQSRDNEIISQYGGNTFSNQEEFFNVSNAGAVLVFDNLYSNDWSKVAIGINYRLRADLDESFFAEGNGNIATFTEFPLDTASIPLVYNNPENQSFSNFIDGHVTELNVGFSAVHKERLYIGLGLNLVGIDFYQQSILRETNNDGNGNVLNARFLQENFTSGSGFSATLGMIYKVNDVLRLGVSYQTPNWFTEIIEDTNITNNDGFFGNTLINVSNSNVAYDNTIGGTPIQSLIYRLRTPSRITLSSALVFGKMGLISFDYSSRNFQNLNLSRDDFTQENQFFDTNLRRTHNFNVGTEWRIKRLSLRGGYRYEQSPDDNAVNSDNLQSYSLGLGYNFGNFKIDLSYSDNNRTSIYNFYPQFQNSQPANLDIDNRIVAASLTINL